MNDEKHLLDFPNLTTKRIVLRKLSLSDAHSVYEYASIPELSYFLIWEEHKSIQDSIDFINFAEAEFSSQNSIIWGIELKETGKIIGTIDLRNFATKNRCSETGYCIHKNYWNMGIVSEALTAVINFGFSKLKLNRIESHCEPENIGSWRVMEKCGMTYEGTLRQKIFMKNKFRTMKYYSILITEWEKNEN